MGLELGRVGGQMLKSDLIRLGVDLAFETDLLYLNVNDGRIGINTDSPSRTLEINNSVLTTDLIVDTQAKIDNLIFDGNTVSSTLGNIYINALGPNSSFYFAGLGTDQLKFKNNIISTFNSNAGIDLRPHGLGNTIIGTATAPTELNITGNLHSTGDITFNGNITFGSDNADSVTFNSDIASDLIPNSNGLTLGNTDYRWSTLETILVNGTAINANSVTAGNSGIDLALIQENIFYVSKNGDDLNSGTHQNDPFLTLAKALSEASNGDTVYIYPGTYEEQLPLTVPAGVTVKGISIRSVTIKPALGYESKDVFLVNGETTIEDLTVSGFRYDSILDVGYAFKFAPGFTVTSRSPYVKNVSVITRGSVTSVSDPLGFDQGDAGRGALVDGSVANSASKEASLLFHAATFITPNADCITMTNGVRVEWLNSFIYYANKGLYAINGAQGFASLGIKFGAEIRSIGSANVYGNFGCVADGADTLMYLISHNFGYIGAGKDDSNDTTLVIQANEVVELNSGQVRYATQDQRGDFRIGDSFFVDFKTGSTSISVEDLGITGLSSLKFISGSNETFITAGKIDTGNFNIELDTIKTVSGDVNISPITGLINFNNSVDIVGNLSIQGDVTVGGQVTVGNQEFDTAAIVGKIDTGINPDITGTYSLGSIVKNWANIYISNLNLDDIRISGNVIRTTQSNSDLELTANGSGKVSIPESDTFFNQILTVNQTSNLKSVDIQGTTTVTGIINLTGDIVQTGNRSIIGNISVDNQSTFSNIRLNTNFITSINNSDLVLTTSGTGKVLIQPSLVVNNNVSVIGNISVPNVTVISDASGNTLTNNTIKIQDNVIENVVMNTSLDLRAAGTGKVVITGNNSLFENNLTVSGSTEFKNTDITGNLTFTGSKNLTGDVDQTGSGSISDGLSIGDFGTFGNVIFNTDWISTTTGDLDLRASGTGKIIIPSNNVTANNIYAGATTFASVSIQQGVSASTITNSDLTITTNYITTNNLNEDLILEASGTGKIYSPTNSWQVDNNLVIGQASALTNLTVTGSLGVTGNINFIGEKTQTGGVSVSNGLAVGDAGTFGNVIFNTDWISTTTGDLDLRASGTGKIIIPSNNVTANNIYAGDTTFASVTIQQGVSASVITNGDLTITTNYITTNNLNTDLIFEANNLGKLYSPTNSWQVDNNLVIGQSTSLKNLTVTGLLAVAGNINHIGNKTQTGDIDISSTVSVTDTVQLGNVIFKTNFVSTAAGDLDLRASGTGKVIIPSNNVIIEKDIYAPTTNFASITVSQTVSAANLTDNTILINGNVITTVNGNDNLVFDPAGVGNVIFGSPTLFDNNFTVNQQTNLKNLAVLGSVTHTGNYQQTGTVNRFGQTQLLGKFVNNSLVQFEDIQVNNNFITTTSTNSNLELKANGTGKVLIPNNNVEIQNNLTIGGLPIFSSVILGNNLAADQFLGPDILIRDNFITTTNGNKNLDLRGVGTGGVFLEELRFTPQNEIRTMSGNRNIVFTPDATKNFVIDKTSALKLPTGTTANRLTLTTSDFRFNTSVNLFEGFNSSAKRTFGGLYSENRQTYIKTEPVASLGTIRFNASGVETMRARNNGLSMNGLIVDGLTDINGNTISTLAGNSDISLIPNGTGKVQLSSRLKVIGSEFTNTALFPSPIVFESTGDGFYKFEGSAGVVIPVGTTAQRSFVDRGDTRWNTELETIEIYDGVQYISAGGAGGVTEAFMEDLSNIYAIILG